MIPLPGALLQWVYAPLHLFAGGAAVPLWSGAIKVDPALVNNAWLLPAVPHGTVDRIAASLMTAGRA